MQISNDLRRQKNDEGENKPNKKKEEGRKNDMNIRNSQISISALRSQQQVVSNDIFEKKDLKTIVPKDLDKKSLIGYCKSLEIEKKQENNIDKKSNIENKLADIRKEMVERITKNNPSYHANYSLYNSDLAIKDYNNNK